MELSRQLSKVLNEATTEEKFGGRKPTLHEMLDIQLQVQEFFMEFMEEATDYLKEFRDEE